MSNWPKPESTLIPVGRYEFRLKEEPVFEPWTFTDKKTGKAKEGNKITFFAIGSNDAGEFDVRESFFVWDKRYADLCSALGVDHGHDIKMAGARFHGEIIHEPDKRELSKVWPRIINIMPADYSESFPTETESADEVVPF
jgi:hypothetical protein